MTTAQVFSTDLKVKTQLLSEMLSQDLFDPQN